MTTNLRYRHTFEPDSGPLNGPKRSLRSPNRREPRQPDWLMILMISFFVLTLLIAWLVDIPALLR
ncbi:hypothetical protein [Larkinella rosea]|uniref:Uncharacterized protein n=1 Tax=Larkinella rosea TaxID=2025312 RepID=A0A3P1BUJ9_9BACT|nr:hypothetical protein [Larkinella rosea]RRB04785.1 hypothetical protein EHT25_15075 [Larkinella rosea]